MDVKIISRKGEIIKDVNAGVLRALETMGLIAEGYAKRLCPVDTGRLRNSITHAIDGESAAIGSYTDDKGGGPWGYSGSTEKEQGENVRSVYIGTNVEYAPIVELGGYHRKATHFLKRAVQGHNEEYKQIITESLQKS